jgi:hypothetical protein
MSENTEPDKENTDTTENEDKKKYPNVYVSIAVASIIIASPFIIYNYFFKSSTPSSIEMPNMPEMPNIPNMPNPFATTEIESKLTSIQDAMSKMENKMDEVDKKVTDLSTKPAPSSDSAPVPEDKGGIFGNIGNIFGTDEPAIVAPMIEDTSTSTTTSTNIENPIKQEKQSSVFDLFSSNDAVANPIVANPIVAEQNNEIPQINNELNNNANIENPFKETIKINETDSKITPAIGEDINQMGQPMAPPQMGQPMAPPQMGQPMAPPQMGQPMAPPQIGQPMAPPQMDQPIAPPQMGQPPLAQPQIGISGGKTRKRRKYKKRKSKKVNLPIVV